MTWPLSATVEVVRELHRQKDAAYRDAWKRRGEVIGVVANIARKVDRLEAALGGAPSVQDETLLDTVVDLLVYCLKYQTFLADHDAAAAQQLFGEESGGPYSDGPDGFERLLSKVPFAAPLSHNRSVGDVGAEVVSRFGDVESCFVGTTIAHPATARLFRVQQLTAATVTLIGALKRDSAMPGALVTR